MSSTFDIARMICIIILMTTICNVFMIFFVYIFVGAAAAFVSCPFSHGYKGVCVWSMNGEQPLITDPIDLHRQSCFTTVDISFISRENTTREKGTKFKRVYYTLYTSLKEK